jgi:hypothetical protein
MHLSVKPDQRLILPVRLLVDHKVDRVGMQALKDAQLTTTNQSLGLTIKFTLKQQICSANSAFAFDRHYSILKALLQ